MAKTINREFQVFKCLCIILICVGHINASYFAGPFSLFPVYSFHVAAFAFIAGYFYKATNEEHPLEYIRKKVVRLLVPTLIINALYGIFVCWLHSHGFDLSSKSNLYCYELSAQTLLVLPFTSGHQFNLNYAMWFVPALVMAESAYVSLRALARRLLTGRAFEAAVAVLCLIAGVVAIRMGGPEGLQPGVKVMLGRAAFLLSFIAIGRLFALAGERILQHDLVAVLVGCCVVQVLLTYLCGGSVKYIPSWLKFPHGALLTYAVSLNGILFWLAVSKMLAPSIGTSKPVNALANNTFSIMLHHKLWYFLMSGTMGVLSLYTGFFSSFNWDKYRASGYRFVPGNRVQFHFLYLLVGLAMPVIMHLVYVAIKRALTQRSKPAADEPTRRR